MFNLTRQERQVILFLITIALVGLGVNFAIKINAKIEKLVKVDDVIVQININVARFEDLIQVKGISPRLARNIIAYRSTYGPFKNLEELKEVKGIGKVKFGQIKDYFTLE